jgi:hypothetical protein
MKPHEIYKTIDPSVVKQMLDWFRANDKNVYRHTLSTLANARKLRLAFVQKKTISDQYTWVVNTLQLKASDSLGDHLLQAWFMAGHQEMLGDFCDLVSLPHDGKGSIKGELPKTFEDEKLDAAITKLVASYDPKIVALYLHVFNMQQEGGWVNLTERLAKNDSLKLA